MDDEWNIVLKEMTTHTKFENNIYEQSINYYRNEKYRLKDYIENEANSYEESEIQNTFPNLSNKLKKQLWQDLTNCVHSAVRLSRLRKQYMAPLSKPNPKPKPKSKPKKNVIIYSKSKHIMNKKAKYISMLPC
eukprot:233058_1